MKLTKQSAQAFTNLRGNPDFIVVHEWIQEHRKKFRDECCTLPPEKVLRAQGKCEVVDGILSAFDSAPSILEKFKQQ